MAKNQRLVGRGRIHAGAQFHAKLLNGGRLRRIDHHQIDGSLGRLDRRFKLTRRELQRGGQPIERVLVSLESPQTRANSRSKASRSLVDQVWSEAWPSLV
ncbi:hypothetical protein EBU58_11240 [bacterium]|nr:hypothetical protein [bacterium]